MKEQLFQRHGSVESVLGGIVEGRRGSLGQSTDAVINLGDFLGFPGLTSTYHGRHDGPSAVRAYID